MRLLSSLLTYFLLCPFPTFQAQAQPLAPLNDEFDNATATALGWSRAFVADGWEHDLVDTQQVSGGAFTVEPHPSGWFRDYRGNFFYKELTGDFVVTANVTATGKTSDVPTSLYSLGGLMARIPNSNFGSWTAGDEQWTFIAMGVGNKVGQASEFEVKTTTNSQSTLELRNVDPDDRNVASPNSLLQLARFGNNMVVLVKPEGSSWRVHRCYGTTAAGAPSPRSPIPGYEGVMQVGMNMYTDWNTWSGQGSATNANAAPPVTTGSNVNPDLRIRYDWVRFCRPQGTSEQMTSDWFASSCTNSPTVWRENCCLAEAQNMLLDGFLGDDGYDCPDEIANTNPSPSPAASPSASPTRSMSPVAASSSTSVSVSSSISVSPALSSSISPAASSSTSVSTTASVADSPSSSLIPSATSSASPSLVPLSISNSISSSPTVGVADSPSSSLIPSATSSASPLLVPLSASSSISSPSSTDQTDQSPSPPAVSPSPIAEEDPTSSASANTPFRFILLLLMTVLIL